MDFGNPKDLTGLVAVVLIFGGGSLCVIISIIAENWRKARAAEQNAVLKKAMIDKGYSAEEIVRVITSGGAGKGKMAEKAPDHAHSA